MKVAVVGLGSVGSFALWQLAATPGIEAVGFEQFGIGHGYGGYTGESRLFRAAYHEGAKYVPLLRRSRELWLQLSELAGRSLLHPFGVLSVGREQDEPFQRLLDSVRRHELPHERLDAAALRERYPQLHVRDDEAAVLDLQGGALRPELGVLSALEQAQRLGAQVHDHARIHRIETGPDGVRIVGDRESIEVDRLIVTAGSWGGELAPVVRDLVEVRRIVLTWFVPKDPAAFAPERLPCFIRDRDGFHVFGAPVVDGYSAKIAGGDVWGKVVGARPEQTQLRLDAAAVSEFGHRVTELFPGVWPEPVRYSVHHDGYTVDKTPVVDWAGSGNVVVVAGLSGHGFKLAPALGELAVQLATAGGAPLYHPDFAISVHKPIASVA